MKFNERQKVALAKYFWDSATVVITIVVIGNSVKPDIPVIRSVIATGLAILFAVIGYVIQGTVDDDKPPRK